MNRLLRILLPFVAVCSAALAQEPVSYNTTLFGSIDPAPDQGGRYSALTGYAAPDGREYALLGGYKGTHIIDVTDSPIREVAFIAGPTSGWRELKTLGTYAYVVTEGGGGLQIIDLSQLPATATLATTDKRYITQAHTIDVQGHYIYINGAMQGGASGGTLIFDAAANPLQPTLVGIYSKRYVHDVAIRNDTLYAAEINDGQLDIIYLGADRANPTLVADIRYPGAGTHNADLTKDGSYVMTTDEIGTTEKTLKVWDIHDVNDISKVADFTPVPGQIIHNVHIIGDIAYVSWYTAGTRILDISDPTNPVEVGFYDTYPGASATYDGNWEVYPFLPSGKLLASDMQTGLYVFTYNGARRGSVEGTVRDAVTNQPIPAARIDVPALGRTTVTDANGHYRIAEAEDTLAFSATEGRHHTATGTLVLSHDGSTQDILMQPTPFVPLHLSVASATTRLPVKPFSYRVVQSEGDTVSNSNPETLELPADSTVEILIGAWGFVPRKVTVTTSAEPQQLYVELQPGYVDDVELDLGWSLSDVTDDASTGAWERGVPIATVVGADTAQPGEDHTPDGRIAFVTGLTGSDQGAGANDVDDGHTSLTTPRFDLSNANTDAAIDVALWYSKDLNSSADDALDVLVSNDDGVTWSTLERLNASTRGWSVRHYPLDGVVDFTDQMRFRVVASDLGSPSLVEAAVDDFRITGVEFPLGVRASSMVDRSRVTVVPNPASSCATIVVSHAVPAVAARLDLVDSRGERVATLFTGAMPSGESRVSVDLRGLPSGVYQWRLWSDGRSDAEGTLTVVQ